MRVIVVGCEYSGVTTLIEGIMDWGHERDINHHLDDHFTIPDRQHLAPEDRETMVHLSPALKERFQRMQLVYHIRLLHRLDHILLGGFHIEEAIYGPLYYYPGGVASEIRNLGAFDSQSPSDSKADGDGSSRVFPHQEGGYSDTSGPFPTGVRCVSDSEQDPD